MPEKAPELALDLATPSDAGERLALFALTLGAGWFRFHRLALIPPGFHYDEAFEAVEALRVLQTPGYHPIFFPGNFGVEPIFIYLTALAFRLVGPSPVAMRSVAAILGTVAIPLVYGLAREMRKNLGIAITCIRPYFVKTEVVMEFMEGRDLSGWEEPEMWTKYTAMVAAADPQSVTGKILDKAALEEMFGPV